MSDASNVQPGDKVSWSWGAGQPAGTAAEVKEDTVIMETARGNEVKKDGEPGDPAVRVERSGHDVVKKASELEVEKKASGGQEEKKEDGVTKNDDGKDIAADGKPDADTKEAHAEQKAETKGEKKDQHAAAATNGDKKADKKKPAKESSAPPPKKEAAKKEAPKKEAKPKPASKPKAEKAKRKAATESGEPRRSKRIRSDD